MTTAERKYGVRAEGGGAGMPTTRERSDEGEGEGWARDVRVARSR